MIGLDVAAAIRTEQQHDAWPDRWPARADAERAGVGPLQVVEEQRERLAVVRERLQQADEDRLEARLTLGRRQRRDRRLRAEHQLELGQDVDHELSERTERGRQRGPPAPDVAVALGQQPQHRRPQRLDVRVVRPGLAQLIELAGVEAAAQRSHAGLQGVDEGGLADAGGAAHQHDLGPALRTRSAACRSAATSSSRP
ncbi:hypothetical protein OV079_53210 [Nannocystis pusilla]|uniref:Uncharacterized protein n=1 Tax=Nannocystis pusilla TaxID=889268 RepID=A0A9X3F2M6_9BACT|nr:hypothetical protein [Nannocystis pusilla]MCY1014135.1 hypothetical protein [Nannocystis pusilla]